MRTHKSIEFHSPQGLPSVGPMTVDRFKLSTGEKAKLLRVLGKDSRREAEHPSTLTGGVKEKLKFHHIWYDFAIDFVIPFVLKKTWKEINVKLKKSLPKTKHCVFPNSQPIEECLKARPLCSLEVHYSRRRACSGSARARPVPANVSISRFLATFGSRVI